MKCLSDYF